MKSTYHFIFFKYCFEKLINVQIALLIEKNKLILVNISSVLESGFYFFPLLLYTFLLYSLGLRKVSDDMKTHKNPALRQGPAPFQATPKPTSSKPEKVQMMSGKPLIELQNKKWVVVSSFNNNILILQLLSYFNGIIFYIYIYILLKSSHSWNIFSALVVQSCPEIVLLSKLIIKQTFKVEIGNS